MNRHDECFMDTTFLINLLHTTEKEVSRDWPAGYAHGIRHDMRDEG